MNLSRKIALQKTDSFKGIFRDPSKHLLKYSAFDKAVWWGLVNASGGRGGMKIDNLYAIGIKVFYF